MMRSFLVLVLSIVVISVIGQHNEIIFQIPTYKPIHFNKGDYYYVTGTADPNLKLEIEDESGKKFDFLQFSGKFYFESGCYHINKKKPTPTSANIIVVSKETHLTRNKYNKQANGILKEHPTRNKIFIDSENVEWKLQSQTFNVFHKPEENVKLLRDSESGGTYETIRKVEEGEGVMDKYTNVPDICNLNLGISKFQVIKVISNELKGPNIEKGTIQASYNFGKDFNMHCVLDMRPHEEWGGDYNESTINKRDRIYECSKKNDEPINRLTNTSLFLFDLSGSMKQRGVGSKSKLQEAKDAAKHTLSGLKNNADLIKSEVGVLGFSGGCSNDPTKLISGFEKDLTIVEQKIDKMYAGGGTPLAEAIAASECKLADHLASAGEDKGKLIILSDGDATCKKIRPDGVYNKGQLGQQIVTVSANQCNNSNQKRASIKYYTVGFNIPAGSNAERDLQYLADISGGKYLNVQTQDQLEEAFKKFNRLFIPKEDPSKQNLGSSAKDKFYEGVAQIKNEFYEDAYTHYIDFTTEITDDCNGYYNLALMQEANDYFNDAIDSYNKYVSLCPDVRDVERVNKKIVALKKEYEAFKLFQKEVVLSDLEYLKLHFKKIQNGESIRLANEFKGFLKEKGNYYNKLPKLIGRTERLFKTNAKEVANGLNNCSKTIKSSPETWDRDATPVISMTYLNLERLIESF